MTATTRLIKIHCSREERNSPPSATPPQTPLLVYFAEVSTQCNVEKNESIETFYYTRDLSASSSFRPQYAVLI